MEQCVMCGKCCMDVGQQWLNSGHPVLQRIAALVLSIDGAAEAMQYGRCACLAYNEFGDGYCSIQKFIGVASKPSVCRDYPFGGLCRRAKAEGSYEDEIAKRAEELALTSDPLSRQAILNRIKVMVEDMSRANIDQADKDAIEDGDYYKGPRIGKGKKNASKKQETAGRGGHGTGGEGGQNTGDQAPPEREVDV